MNFVERVRKGKALLDQIDDYVDNWIGSSSIEPIHKFLGMTKPEYDKWLKDRSYLRFIVYGDTTKKKGRGKNNKKGDSKGTPNFGVPELNLVASILEDAVLLVLKDTTKLKSQEKYPRQSAYLWIRNMDDWDLFSFNSICSVLGIDPSWLRVRVLQMLGKPYTLPKEKPHVFYVGNLDGGQNADDSNYWGMYKMGWSLMHGPKNGKSPLVRRAYGKDYIMLL